MSICASNFQKVFLRLPLPLLAYCTIVNPTRAQDQIQPAQSRSNPAVERPSTGRNFSIVNVGVFAGGPFMCAGHSNYTACMYNASISTQMLSTMQADINNWSDTAIDNKANVAQQKIYLFVGTSDTTVGPNPMK